MEWGSLLRTQSTIMNGPEGPKRVRFQMEIPHHVSVYMWNTVPRQFDLVIYEYTINIKLLTILFIINWKNNN